MLGIMFGGSETIPVFGALEKSMICTTSFSPRHDEPLRATLRAASFV
jgi:hypothetical protein